MRRSAPPPFYADKLWGHGRSKQLLVRAWCGVVGHKWKDPWDGVLYCSRSCGGMRKEHFGG